MSLPPPDGGSPVIWPDAAGQPVACRDKLKVLRENHAELAQVLRDVFDDAVLMGVDEAAMRTILVGMIAGLPSPRLDSGPGTATTKTGPAN
jgi:hypothetical protein